MIGIQEVSFPAFVLFQIVQRHDEKGKQPQFQKELNDGRTLVVVPDQHSLTPVTDIRIPVTPGRVIYEGSKYVIVTCFVPEKYSLAHQIRKGLFAGATKKPEGKRASKPKPAKPVTGRFVGERTPPIKAATLNGPNVLSFAQFAEEQRQVAARLAAKKNAGKKEPKKEKGSRRAGA